MQARGFIARIALVFLCLVCLVSFSQGQTNPNLEKFKTVFTKGADWLVSQQKANGSWLGPFGDKSDVAITGLTLRALAKAPADLRAKYAASIDKGVAYIVGCIQPDGKVIDKDVFPTLSNYKSAIALMALVAVDKEKHKESIGKILMYLKANQWNEKTGVAESDFNYGGWDYDEKGKKAGADLSNVGMTLEALDEAGLAKDDETWNRAVRFLQRCMNSTEYNDFAGEMKKRGYEVLNDGGMAYSPVESKAGEEANADGTKGLRSYGSMTYIGLKSFIYAGVDKKDPRVQAIYKWLQAHYTLEENPEMEKQGWYYYFHMFGKALNVYGEKTIKTSDGKEHFWAEELVNKLAELQQKDGYWVNSNDRWFEDFKPLVTAYCLLALDECQTWIK